MSDFDEDRGWLTGWEEHVDFENGAEDMEHRAYRLEAEREADMEAYWDMIAQQEGDR